jgi:hypothetical protein
MLTIYNKGIIMTTTKTTSTKTDLELSLDNLDIDFDMDLDDVSLLDTVSDTAINVLLATSEVAKLARIKMRTVVETAKIEETLKIKKAMIKADRQEKALLKK